MSSPVVRKQADAYLQTVIEDELVLILRDTGKFFSLKDVGLRIWNALDRQDDLDALCSELEREYDVPPTTCRADVDKFVGQLVESGFAAYG